MTELPRAPSVLPYLLGFGDQTPAQLLKRALNLRNHDAVQQLRDRLAQIGEERSKGFISLETEREVPPSRKAAQAAAQHVGEMLALAKTDADRRRIGDMLKATRNGAPLPSIEDAQRRLGLGLDPAQEGVTVGQWLDTWLAAKRRNKRESTCRGYEMHIRTWLKPQLAHLPLERLSAGHIEELFATISR